MFVMLEQCSGFAYSRGCWPASVTALTASLYSVARKCAWPMPVPFLYLYACIKAQSTNLQIAAHLHSTQLLQGQSIPAQPGFGSLQPGMAVGCVVSETSDDHAWLALAPGVRGRLHVLDSAAQPQQLAAFSQRFKVS